MKAQASVEFLVFLSFLIVVFLVSVFNQLHLSREVTSIKSDEELKTLCGRIKFEIDSAVNLGDTYKRNFYLNAPYGNENITITIKSYYVFIDAYSKSLSCNIITNNITGAIKIGWNLIENKNGVIYVT
jgi:hypothetical protein